MLTSTTQKSLLALTVAGLLFSAATAQGGGSPEVKRDPFINNQSAPAINHTIRQPKQTGNQPVLDRRQNQAPSVTPAATQPQPVIVVAAPEVTVNGIVASAGQRQAIITTSQGSRIVTVGQKLADYRVKAIDNKSVTFEAQGKSFKINLGQES